MEAFQWNASFITGLHDVDEQHRRLVDLINRFGSLTMDQDSTSATYLEAVFAELADYARYHFAKLYFAFRELGKVIRTQFLLKYIGNVELRKLIQSETNKSEQFNGFAKTLFFGGEGIIAENIRHEQRKVVKYNHLVANMVILHNVVGMSRTLKALQEEGILINQEILEGLAPYRLQHINRFGDYTLDFRRKVESLNADFRILEGETIT